MNNSRIAIESVSLRLDTPHDNKAELTQEEAKLLRVIEALHGVAGSREWGTLKTELFDGLVESLTRDLTHEAKKETPDTLKLNRLAGQLKWAESYADLTKLEQTFRTKLTNVRKVLYGKT